jgi:hypothetical protein
MMKSCWYETLVVDVPDCRLTCSECEFYMPDPPEPEDRDEKDELPRIEAWEVEDDL